MLKGGNEMRSGILSIVLIFGVALVAPAESLPVTTGFEQPSFTAGPLPQQGWTVETGSASIQTAVRRSGTQALRIDTDSQIDKDLQSPSTELYIDAWYRADNLDGDRPDIASLAAGSSILVFESANGIVALNGNGSGGGTWQVVGVPLTTGQFYRITIRQNYGTHTWDLFVNGNPNPVATGLGFKNNTVNSISGLKVKAAPSGNSYLDDFAAVTSLPDFLIPTSTPTPQPTSTPTPIGPDFDGDGIADSLEGGKAAGTQGKSNMYLSDSDSDGLKDGIEDINRSGARDAGETNPVDVDSDDDNFEDGIEVLILGTNPLSAGSPGTTLVDNDGDKLPAANDPNDSNADTDGDRYSDGIEAILLGIAAATNSNMKPSIADVDNNLNVDNGDAQKILNFFASLPQPVFNPDNSDPDRNGSIDNADAQHTLNFFAHLAPTLPIR